MFLAPLKVETQLTAIVEHAGRCSSARHNHCPCWQIDTAAQLATIFDQAGRLTCHRNGSSGCATPVLAENEILSQLMSFHKAHGKANPNVLRSTVIRYTTMKLSRHSPAGCLRLVP